MEVIQAKRLKKGNEYMEENMFELFVSTHSNITNPFSDLTGDQALGLNIEHHQHAKLMRPL